MLPIKPDEPAKPTLESRELLYSQQGDSCGGDVDQYLKIKTDDAGGGPFIIIETERWSFEQNEIPALVRMFESVLAGLEHQPDAGGEDCDEAR